VALCKCWLTRRCSGRRLRAAAERHTVRQTLASGCEGIGKLELSATEEMMTRGQNTLTLCDALKLGIYRTPGPWALVAFIALCSCAGRQVATKQETSRTKTESPPGDLFCDRDADCEISTTHLTKCDRYLGTEPYAISRAAMARHRVRLDAECTGGWNPSEYIRCGTMASDWIAVCIGHVCERHSARMGQKPKSSCPPPTEPLFPGYRDPGP
jgi:hypothetical protein